VRRARGARRRDLDGLDALVLPGGESTTMTLGIEREGLAAPLRELCAACRCSAPAPG
jgi:glutamine amidotransferase PdxT